MFSDVAKSDKCLIYPTGDYSPHLVRRLKVTPPIHATPQYFAGVGRIGELCGRKAFVGNPPLPTSEEKAGLLLITQCDEQRVEEEDVFDDAPSGMDKGIEDCMVGDITWKASITGITAEQEMRLCRILQELRPWVATNVLDSILIQLRIMLYRFAHATDVPQDLIYLLPILGRNICLGLT